MRSEILRKTFTCLAARWKSHLLSPLFEYWLSGSSGDKLVRKRVGSWGWQRGSSKVLPDKGDGPTLSEEEVRPIVQLSPDKSTVPRQVQAKARTPSQQDTRLGASLTYDTTQARTKVLSLNAAPLSAGGGPTWGFSQLFLALLSEVCCFPSSLTQGDTAVPGQGWPWLQVETLRSGEKAAEPTGGFQTPTLALCSGWGWCSSKFSVEVKSSQEWILSVWHWLHLCS